MENILKTNTSINNVNGIASIITSYWNSSSPVNQVVICSNNGVFTGITAVAGSLIVSSNNEINLSLNNGELEMEGDLENNFSINNNGELMFTEP